MQRRCHLARLVSRALLCSIMTIASTAALGNATNSMSDRSPALDTVTDSPDGDPMVRTLTFPADLVPLGPGPSTPAPDAAATITADFASNGIAPEGDSPTGAAFTPNGTKIVVAHRDTRNLIVFDAVTRAFLDEIPLSGSPNGVAISPDGTRAVTPNVYEDTASIVDLTTGAEIAVVPVGDQPGVVRISPDGTIAVVGNTVSSNLSVIDLATATEVRRIAGVAFVGSVGISFEAGAVIASFSSFEFAGNTRLVHPDYYGNRILIVDIPTGVVTPLPSSNTPRGVAVTPDGTKAIVTHFLTPQTLSVVDPAAATIVKTIAIGADLDGPVAIDPTGTKAVVAIQNACRVVNLVTNAVSASLNTASVNQLLTTADGNYALAVGFRGALVSYASEAVVRELNNVVSTALGAVSPTAPRAAMVANLFGEDMVVVNTNGAAGFIEGVLPSGPPPEGDKARSVALRPDGSEAVAVNIFGDNVSIVDVGTLATAAILPVGNRPSEVEITPDGTKAVVANLDSDFVSVVNLVTRTVTNIPISTRGSEVEISPDGLYAYVAVVVSDGVWRINLQTLSVAGPFVVTGNMGSINYPYSQSSGITLSHDGATLVTCNSFSNSISIIDTGTWAVVKTLGVGTFPVRATFSADDSRIYIASRDDDRITEVVNAGSSSVVFQTIPVGDWPYQMVLAPSGATLYVANYLAENIGVVNLATGVMTSVIPLPDPPAGIAIDPTGAFLHATTGTWSVSLGPGPVYSIATSGQFSVIDLGTQSIVEQAVTGIPPAMLDYNASAGLAAAPSPFGDGVTLVAGLATTGLDAPAPAPRLTLGAPAPNPMRAATTFAITLPASADVEIAIHDVSGRAVATLVQAGAPAGRLELGWDGRGANGERVPAGLYVARIRAGAAERAVKLVIVP